ncbi:MAG TPA: Do family serine endopeptidase [Pseudolabrys sp.]|nr:Do family serine endopeptidase [Pseudolabrys sp.]
MIRFIATVLALIVASVAAAPAQDRRVPTANEVRLSYSPIVKHVAPAVVNVYAAKTVQTRNPLFDDPIFRRFFGGGPGGPGSQVQRSLGSGVIVDPTGLIVTNVHVIEGADEIKVSLADKREFEATVVLKDPRTDLAILRIKDGAAFPFLEFANSDALEVGDLVLAIGNPFGVGQTVTHGIVSALARTQVGVSDYQFFIQTDAAINPGNSGGALVDFNGRLVGINTAIFSRSGGSQGVGFAIPTNMVRVVVASAKAGGSGVRRPWLGANLQSVTADIADSMGLKRPTGALISNVRRDGPAAKAGLKAGDLIVSIDGQDVDDSNAFDYRFATKPLGGSAKLGIIRAGKEMAATVELTTAPDAPRDEITIQSRSPFSGARVANLSPALADEMQLQNVDNGVVIVSTEDGSVAGNLGFQRGDVIQEVNGTAVGRTRDLDRIANTPSNGWRIVILRRGQKISAMFGG